MSLASSTSPLGVVTGKAEPHKFAFLASRGVRVGEYVTTDAPEGRLLGLVENAAVTSSLLDGVVDFRTAVEAKAVAAKNSRDKGYVAQVKVLGLLEELKKGSQFMPSLAPEPGADVDEASPTELAKVFSKEGREWAKIGALLRNRDVPVSINVNKMASRHLAILAATGSGKSNLLALIAKRVADLNGTMLVFDYQGEYSDLRLSNVVHVKAKINPRLLDVEDLADMLDVRESAEKQRSVLAKVFSSQVREAPDFWDALVGALKSYIGDGEAKADDKRVAERLIEIVQRAVRRKAAILDPAIGDPVDHIQPNHINVLNMLELTEMQASIVIAYYLGEILEDRKRARRYRLTGEADKDKDEKIRFVSPVVFAIEEAHSFLPEDRDTEAKYIASKIAREGRKFGASLIVVSQRPSRLSQDVLSQMGSLAVSRITQPKDQTYIIESSELVTEELVAHLPSLNVGEALLLGQWVTLPSVAKIDRVDEKLMGADIDAVDEWSEDRASKSVAAERTSDLIRED
jgi:hypothetical protein